MAKPTDWWKETIIYQIYPWSFADSNGDGIGDLPGILTKLPYLSSLGVETIWFSPFFKTPGKDHGYDISDYLSIDSRFGSMLDIDRLIREIHKRKMKIVLDMVMNHTSDEHPWFLEAKKDLTNPKRDFYIWKRGKGKRPPNNWKSMVGTSGWNFDKTTNEYYYSNFLSFQPDLNYRNPSVKTEMFKVLEFWLKKGVDGFRLDIFNSIFKDEMFRDNPSSKRFFPTPDNHDEAFFQKKAYNLNLPESFALAKEVRQCLSKYKQEPFLIGEVSGSDLTLKGFLGEKADGLHLVFQFELIDFQWNVDFFRTLLEKNEREFPSPYQPVYVFGNHDQRRYIDRIDGDSNKAKLLSTFQTTVRGVPVIYYGEEIGRKEGRIPPRNGLDPIAKQNKWVPLWLSNLLGIYLNRDNCRLPMLWDETKNAGFTSGEPWLPLGDYTLEDTIRFQEGQDKSLLEHYKTIFKLRKKWKSLRKGSLVILPHREADLLEYERHHAKERIRVTLYFGKNLLKLNIPPGAKLLYYFGEVEENQKNLLLTGASGALLQYDTNAGNN